MSRETGQIRVRRAESADAEGIRAIYNHHIEQGVATFDIEPKSLEDRQAWMRGFSDSGPYRLLVAVDGDERVLGFACSIPFNERDAYRSSIQVSAYLAEGMGRKGIGTRLYEALFEELRPLGLHRAYAGITIPNPASEAIHARFGFREAARFTEVGFKFGRYHDVIWLEKRMDEEERP